LASLLLGFYLARTALSFAGLVALGKPKSRLTD
jgi:hypothetical protein